jgi:hypothetical protein
MVFDKLFEAPNLLFVLPFYIIPKGAQFLVVLSVGDFLHYRILIVSMSFAFCRWSGRWFIRTNCGIDVYRSAFAAALAI